MRRIPTWTGFTIRAAARVPYRSALPAALVALVLVTAPLPFRAGGAAAPPLVTSTSSGRITVATEDFPTGGWQIVFDDALEGSIAEFRVAGAKGGDNLTADGSWGARAGLFEKIWGTERGAHWLSGEWGRVEGGSVLAEAGGVRARVVQTVHATDTLPGEAPTALSLTYTLYPSGRMMVDAWWELTDVGVLGSTPYADNSWRLVLANGEFLFGGEDQDALAALLDNGAEGLPQLLFAAFPRFWVNGSPLSLDDPDTRDVYVGAACAMDRISDYGAGIAAARFSGSYREANPYQVGNAFRHVFLIDWSRPGPGVMADAVEMARDFDHPDPLDGAPAAGEVLVGTRVSLDAADLDGDGYVEGEGCYHLRASANQVKWRLGFARGGEEAIAFRHPAFKIENFDVDHDSLSLLLSNDGGESWQELARGDDYLMSTYLEEAQVGENTRLVSLIGEPSLSPVDGIMFWFAETEGLITATVLHGPELSASPGEVRVGWQCRQAGLYRGYHVARRETPEIAWTRCTPSLIPDETRSGGRSYEWRDRGVVPGREYLYRVEAYPRDGGEPFVITAGLPIRAAGDGPGGPAEAGSPLMALPNPFTPEVNLRFRVPEGGDEVVLDVHDTQGRLVRRLLAGPLSAGTRSASWDGCDQNGMPVASGVYVVRLGIGRLVSSVKVVLRR